jgi:hypothetical protein
LLNRLELHEQEALACGAQHQVAYGKVLSNQERTGGKLLQIPESETGERNAKLKPEWDLAKMCRKYANSCWQVFVVVGIKAAQDRNDVRAVGGND